MHCILSIVFLAERSSELKNYFQKRKELEQLIQYHRNILQYRTIPRKFRPPTTPTTVLPNPILTDEFTKKYEQLFFEHVEKVITSDNISLELNKAAITSVLSQTEIYLSSLPTPPQKLTEIYYNFLSENHVTDHTPLPVLQTKLQTPEITNTPPHSNLSAPTTDMSPKQIKRPNRKRKQKQSHPRSEKKSKHFLSQGPHPPLKPP